MGSGKNIDMCIFSLSNATEKIFIIMVNLSYFNDVITFNNIQVKVIKRV